MDTNFFDAYNYGRLEWRTDERTPYAVYMIKKLAGEETQTPHSDRLAAIRTRFEQLFSVSYFQSSAGYLYENGSWHFDRYGVADETTTAAYYMPDGSRVYTKKIAETDVEQVMYSAAISDLNGHTEHLDEESKNIFVKFIEYLISQDKKLIQSL